MEAGLGVQGHLRVGRDAARDPLTREQERPVEAETKPGAEAGRRRVVVIVVLGFALRLVLHKVTDRVAEKIATGTAGLGRLDERLPNATAVLSTSPLLSARREQRARTTASGSSQRSSTTSDQPGSNDQGSG